MSSERFPEKMDALDLIINALKDHEKSLDSISDKLKTLLEIMTEKEYMTKVINKEETSPKKPLVIVCTNWDEFKNKCKGSQIITFEIDGRHYTVYASLNENIFRYSETLPSKTIVLEEEPNSYSIKKTTLISIDLFDVIINRRLKCGLRLPIQTSKTTRRQEQFIIEINYDIKSNDVKNFLARELDLAKKDIIEGRISQ